MLVILLRVLGVDIWLSWYMLVILLRVLGVDIWPSWYMLAILLRVPGVEIWPSWYTLVILLSILGLPSNWLFWRKEAIPGILGCVGLTGESGGWMSICGTWFQILDFTLFHRNHPPYHSLKTHWWRLILCQKGRLPQTYFSATLYHPTEHHILEKWEFCKKATHLKSGRPVETGVGRGECSSELSPFASSHVNPLASLHEHEQRLRNYVFITLRKYKLLSPNNWQSSYDIWRCKVCIVFTWTISSSSSISLYIG